MADVFPPRDLPGRSEEWGRQVENRIEGGEKSEKQLEQKVDNGLRATGGQLAVLSRQLDLLTEQQNELQLGRRTHTAQLNTMSLTASTPGTYLDFTQNFSITGPYEEGRSATVSVTAYFRRTSASGNMTVWTELLRGSEVVWRRTGAVVVGDTLSAPAAWGNPGFSDAFFIPAPLGSENYTIRFYTHTFVAGTVNAVAENMSITFAYGDPL